MNNIPTGERHNLFFESCYHEWQSVEDLMCILQCSCKRTIRRMVSTFKAMTETNEISKFLIEFKVKEIEDRLPGPPTSLIRIINKPTRNINEL